MHRKRIAGSYGHSMLNFLRNCYKFFSAVTVPFYIPIMKAQGFHFSALLLTLVILLSFFFFEIYLFFNTCSTRGIKGTEFKFRDGKLGS